MLWEALAVAAAFTVGAAGGHWVGWRRTITRIPDILAECSDDQMRRLAHDVAGRRNHVRREGDA